MRRVLVLGSPGAGKSTFSRQLHELSGLPLVHLDQLFWSSGWKERDKAEYEALLTRALAEDRWIIDGNYGSSLAARARRADTIIWLDYPTALSLWRLLVRWWTYRGRSRPDMPTGCPERLDLSFVLFVATFRRRWHARNEQNLAMFSGEILRFTRPAQTQAWLSRFG